MGRFDGRGDEGVEVDSLQDSGDVCEGVSRGVELLHHSILAGRMGISVLDMIFVLNRESIPKERNERKKKNPTR